MGNLSIRDQRVCGFWAGQLRKLSDGACERVDLWIADRVCDDETGGGDEKRKIMLYLPEEFVFFDTVTDVILVQRNIFSNF